MHLDSPLLPEVEALIPGAMGPLESIFLLRVPSVLLGPGSIPFWMDTRRSYTGGVDLDEYAAGVDVDQAWRDAAAGIGKVTELLNRTEGPFFAGEEVGYVDFVWAGYLLFVKVQGEDVWEKVLEASGDGKAHERLLEALAPWTKRDN